jgi:hypothetical protein
MDSTFATALRECSIYSFAGIYGFRKFDVQKVALSHNVGDLPPPNLPHRFL